MHPKMGIAALVLTILAATVGWADGGGQPAGPAGAPPAGQAMVPARQEGAPPVTMRCRRCGAALPDGRPGICDDCMHMQWHREMVGAHARWIGLWALGLLGIAIPAFLVARRRWVRVAIAVCAVGGLGWLYLDLMTRRF